MIGNTDSSIFGSFKDVPDAVLPLLNEIEEAYIKNPPTIAVIGLSGVGKSSTINAMFKTNLPVSATIRGTTKFESVLAKLSIQRSDAAGNAASLRVYDAPGLGEDRALDPQYLRMYEENLPKCDVALWVIAARNRALALDQKYLEILKPHLGKVVFGISQCDLVDPLDWEGNKNLPSQAQSNNINEIIKDRSEKLSNEMGYEVKCVAYSSSKFYRLMELYEHIVNNSPEDRRWLFELVRAFDASDWLKQASGLSEEEKNKIMEKF